MRDLPKFIAIQLLRAYKWAISPMLPPSCRYVPTCSEYAIEAVERHGALRGGWMALARILRCHPFVRGGHDPVIQSAGSRKAKEWKVQLAKAQPWKSGASAPRYASPLITGFSPCDCAAQPLERNL